MVELMQRTNQFNTTMARFGADELRECTHDYPRSAVYVLDVSDRFAAYGLVGICVVRRDEIAAVVISCRVIPLRAEVPFLSAVLRSYARAPIGGVIVEGPRNQPCQHLYKEAHFEDMGLGKYLLPQLSRLPPIDENIYHIEQLEEDPLS